MIITKYYDFICFTSFISKPTKIVLLYDTCQCVLKRDVYEKEYDLYYCAESCVCNKKFPIERDVQLAKY